LSKIKGPFKFLVFLFFILAALRTGFAQIPQDYHYQKELRSFIGSLKAEDFEVEIQELDLSEVYNLTDDQLFRTWILLENRGREVPDFSGLLRNARYFTLRELEKNGTVNMNIGRNEFHDPISTAWWSIWDYPGNPYYGSRAVKLRAAVTAMVDMMMLERYHEDGRGRRADFAGTSLLRMGYVYDAAKDILPEDIRQYYEEGMLRLFSRIEEWGPTLIHADMDMFAVAGVWAVAESMESDPLRERAGRYVRRVFEGAYREAGYIHHGGGFDPSYQGITLGFAGWAAMLSRDSFLIEKVDQMSRLKAYLSFPDPDGEWHGPSNFATSNDAGSPNDGWESYQRDIGLAMLSKEARYLIWSGRDRPDWYATGMYPPGVLRERVAANLQNISHRILNEGRSDLSPKPWREDHWTNLGPFAHQYYKQGSYREFWEMQENGSPLMNAPVNRSGTYTETFRDEFLVAKRPSFAAVIHTGGLSDWGDEKKISGLGGGGISVFWKAETGAVVLGKQKGFQNDKTGPDRWEDWMNWPVHAISGETAAGHPFSSARQRNPRSVYSVSEADPSVEVSGTLNDRYADPENALEGEISYKRIYKVKGNGLSVRSAVLSDDENSLNHLYEIIPVFIDNRQDISVNIYFRTEDGEWVQATSEPKGNIVEVKIERFNGTVHISLDNPATVRLSPAEWSVDYQTQSRARNILISFPEFTSGGERTSSEISYTLH